MYVTMHIMNDKIGSVRLSSQLSSKAHFGPIDLSSYIINIQQHALWSELRNSRRLVQRLCRDTKAAFASLEMNASGGVP